ncbi:MAG: hypothetical protein ACFFAN_14745 [Promethearchaeota archaeon]
MNNTNIYIIIDKYLREEYDYSREQFKNWVNEESSIDRLLEVINSLEASNNKRAPILISIMEDIIGEKYLEKYGVVPREAMGLGLLEMTIGQELLNDADYPEHHHVHASFRIKDGHVIDLDIAEVCCPKIQFLHLLPNLENLTITMAGLREIKGLEKLKKLKSLDLASNELKEIDGLEQLTYLKKIHLNLNKFKSLKFAQSMKALEEIILSYNPLSKLKGINKLKNLKYIELEETNLTVKEIKKLKKNF